MKKMLSKVLVSVLVISSMPMHAGLGQSMHNGARSMLQGAGNNAGRIAAIAGGLAAMRLLYLGYRGYYENANDLQELRRSKENDSLAGFQDEKSVDDIKKFELWLGRSKIIVPTISLAVGALAYGAAYYFCKACGSLGSRI